ncbi:glycerol-3-phosphate 1-O-acyltransferase PlsY [Geitlerinema splendidum]|jgi:glycerol-3-phosphate acyltransferase PlsY|nr:glycerol-3-phosphate 1-O-acyltransferase PlsY [Geitlerinema splendidum]
MITLNTFPEIVILVLAYILGSIPSGLLVSWLYKLPDPRTIGSGNIGATNMLRFGNKRAALLTLFFDVLKGSLAVIFALISVPSTTQFAGILAVVGHIWPIWLMFRGGKGVATAFGVMLILNWGLALACLGTWIIFAITTRYSSLASLTTFFLSSIYAYFMGATDVIVTCLILTALVFWTHRYNIERLRKGKETKIGAASHPSSRK